MIAKISDPVRTLTTRELNRTLLARQLLLERAEIDVGPAAGHVGGLQAQYAPSGYVGLWTRVAGFRRHDLTHALENRTVIQATLMRTTIHVVPRADYWKLVMGTRRSQQAWAMRTQYLPPEGELRANADRLRDALAEGPKTVKELGDLAKGFIGSLGYWVPLVRVPPSGTWEHRRADRLALAEDWVGPIDATEEEGLTRLVELYLHAFGPAAWKDIALWAGVAVSDLKRSSAALGLARYRDPGGGDLVDLADAQIIPGDTAAPVRFLPHWDANLLVHARRAAILPEEHRPRVFSTKNPFSVGTVLVDGRVVAGWSLKEGRIVVDPFETIRPREARHVERERAALEAFHR